MLQAVTEGPLHRISENVRDSPAHKRRINTVFQSYGLFPQMTIEENVGFGLKMLGKKSAEIVETTARMLASVHLQALAKRINRKTGITFVLVIHDQEEAMSISDRIAVVAEGKIQQLGDPETIYEQPKNSFVANWIGEMNLFEVDWVKEEQEYIGNIRCTLLWSFG